VIGDSITEMAPLLRQLCGHAVVNAGIGGMNIREATNLTPQLLAAKEPLMIAPAVGANDIGSKRAGRFEPLRSRRAPIAATIGLNLGHHGSRDESSDPHRRRRRRSPLHRPSIA